jgi:hypothetical protein
MIEDELNCTVIFVAGPGACVSDTGALMILGLTEMSAAVTEREPALVVLVIVTLQVPVEELVVHGAPTG